MYSEIKKKKSGFSVTLFYPQQRKIFTPAIFWYAQSQYHVETRESKFASSDKSF